MQKMDGEGLPRGRCETVLGYVWIMLGSGRIGPAVELTVQASFSQLQVAGLEGSLAKKHRFHIFNSQFLKVVSHESFVFTTSTCSFPGRPRRKVSFSQL